MGGGGGGTSEGLRAELVSGLGEFETPISPSNMQLVHRQIYFAYVYSYR